jgi:hypothetical protein
MKKYRIFCIRATVEDSQREEFLALLHAALNSMRTPILDVEITFTPLREGAPILPTTLTVTEHLVC